MHVPGCFPLRLRRKNLQSVNLFSLLCVILSLTHISEVWHFYSKKLSDTSFFFLGESYSREGYSSQVGVKEAAPVIISLPSFHMVDVLPYNIIYLVCLLHRIAVSPVTRHSVYSQKNAFLSGMRVNFILLMKSHTFVSILLSNIISYAILMPVVMFINNSVS